jgi:hypothetical protein
MSELDIRIDEIKPAKSATHPQLEINFEPDFDQVSIDNRADILEGHSDGKVSAGNHAGMSVPRVHLKAADL